MTRVGFVLEGPTFQGSVNYFRNLFSALAALPDRPVRPVVFVGPGADAKLLAAFSDAEVVRTSLLDERSVVGRARRRLKRELKGRDPLLSLLLKRHRIAVLSHSATVRAPGVKTVGWIPDFQHAYLPTFFTDDERALRDADFHALASQCDRVIVSSEAAQRDLAAFAPEATRKSTVLRFVPAVEQIDALPLAVLETKYGFTAPYFFMPNQFWIHKNHRLVIDALALLKAEGREATVVMTGSTKDYRHPDHFDQLLARAHAEGVAHGFKVLGTVPYEDLISLMQHAIAIMNPSLFEGWSSSVEEAKALNKTILLSNLPVHLEQNPSKGIFFDPTDAAALAARMRELLIVEGDRPAITALTLSSSYRDDRLRFAEAYRRIVGELVGEAA